MNGDAPTQYHVRKTVRAVEPIFDAAARYLDERDFIYTRGNDPPFILTYLRTIRGEWAFSAYLIEAERVVAFCSVYPKRVPHKQVSAAAELLMRINRNTFIGGFVLDFDTGEIRYVTQAPVSVGAASGEELYGTVTQLVEKNLAMMEEYFSSIVALLSTDASPESAYREAEGEVTTYRSGTFN